MAEYLIQKETMTALADAIRSKTGGQARLSPAEMAAQIGTIAATAKVTASAADVLEGKIIVDSDGNEVTGSMANHAAVSALLNPINSSYTIAEGYHDGNGIVRVNAMSKSTTPSKERQILDGLAYVNPFFLSSVTVEPIPEKYQDVSKVTASAEDVLEGKVFVDAQGNAVMGTLAAGSAGGSTEDVIWVGTATDGAANSQVGSGIIRYVTFMNYDGTVEYGRKSVIQGENCVDPVTGGFLDTPTRESTAQYTYTYAGWATEPNGGLNADALKAVDEDRTVYANFASVLRYYTITFYDSDGTTVLAAKSVAYGSVPSYTPTKDGYDFAGWTPALTEVTGEALYSAVWEEKASFETATWAKIKEICDAGNHKSVFAIGDKKPVTLTYADGTSETINFRIVDMDVDTKQDGSMAPLTLVADNLVKKSIQPASTASNGKSKEVFTECDNAKTFLAELLAALPTDLQEVLATVQKNNKGGTVTTAQIFIPTQKNLANKHDCNSNYYGNQYMLPDKQYQYFANGNTIKRTKLTDSTADDYWTATVFNYVSSTAFFLRYDGTTYASKDSTYNTHGILPCFCI